MPTRYLLYLDANALRRYRWRNGQVEPAGHYPASDAGIKAFAAAVRDAQGAHYTLLTDLVEEGFHSDVLPAVQGRDRSAMLSRKCAQTFFGTPFTAALSVGKSQQGRRQDEHFVLLALTRQAVLEPWLQALRTVNAPLTGIHTVALLFDHVAQRLDAPAERYLLVSFAPGGMRQTYVDHRHVRFSRLAPSLQAINDDTAARCAGEIVKTHAYLTSQRLLPRGTALPVFVLADKDAVSRLHAAAAGSDAWEIRPARLQDLARRSGMSSEVDANDALPVMLHWLGRERGTLQFAPPAERRFFRLWQARQAIIGTGVAVCAAAFLLAGKQWVDARALDAETQTLRMNTVAVRAQLNQLESERPLLPAPLPALRRILDEHAQLRTHAETPRPWLTHLSATLDAQPELQLAEVRWAAGTAAAPLGAGGEASFTLPRALAEDRRALVDSAERVMRTLSRAPAASARVVRMPIELQSDRAIRGSNEPGTDTAAPRLVVHFALERTP